MSAPKTRDWNVCYKIPGSERTYNCTYAYPVEMDAPRVRACLTGLLAGKEIVSLMLSQPDPFHDERGPKGAEGIPSTP